MSADEVRQLLEKVASGRLTATEAAEQLRTLSELPYATVDLDRRSRCGFPEVIFCEGKTAEWVEGVVRKLQEAGQSCLATRLRPEQIAHLTPLFPHAEIDPIGRTFWLPSGEPSEAAGNVLILTAGTGDLPVAREALVTAQALGSRTELIVDVGVAGLHRLLRHQHKLAMADAIVVVAGMDGALPSVVGGLASCPVIAVPTSIGYGTAFGGLAALLTMLNACSASVSVVNIDAGFKGGYVAAMIARIGTKRGAP
jgi:NCAIR mutase (PurE)-related protein